MPELTVLTHEDYADLRRALKEANIDLCYTVQSARPVYTRWSPERIHDAAFGRKVAQRRPADPSYRLASVYVDRPGNWLRPDRLIITFHAVSSRQEATFDQYLDTQYPGREVDPHPESVEVDADHATPKTYILVALLLALITSFEVGLLYLPEPMSPPRWALMVVLLLISALKFGIVASYFMHLRYDHRLYAGFFVAGLVVAASTMFALLALFRGPSGGTRAVTTSEVIMPLPAATALPGDAQAGMQVFHHQGCGSCHAVTHVPGAQGTIGPRLDGLAQRAGNRIPEMPAEAYIRQSIEAPNAYVVQGYLKLMPSLRGKMTTQEFADLVTLLRTL